MIAAVCIDNSGGMLFNNRRVSRDIAVIEDIAKMRPAHIYIDPYSAPLFEKCEADIIASEDFIRLAGENDACFIENREAGEWLSRAERLIVYRWNRSYPADMRLNPLPENNPGLELEERYELKGSSHGCITREIYKKCR